MALWFIFCLNRHAFRPLKRKQQQQNKRKEKRNSLHHRCWVLRPNRRWWLNSVLLQRRWRRRRRPRKTFVPSSEISMSNATLRCDDMNLFLCVIKHRPNTVLIPIRCAVSVFVDLSLGPNHEPHLIPINKVIPSLRGVRVCVCARANEFLHRPAHNGRSVQKCPFRRYSVPVHGIRWVLAYGSSKLWAH